jgi:hypothetical protein
MLSIGKEADVMPAFGGGAGQAAAVIVAIAFQAFLAAQLGLALGARIVPKLHRILMATDARTGPSKIPSRASARLVSRSSRIAACRDVTSRLPCPAR